MDQSQSTALGELVRQAQQGDEVAQRTLIISYQRRIAGFVYAIVGRGDAVEDLAQLVFIKMFRAIGRLHDAAQFEAWLFRLARNTCIDHLRRQKLRRIFTPFSAEHENIAEPAGAVDEKSSMHYGMPYNSFHQKIVPCSLLLKKGAARSKWQKPPARWSWPCQAARLHRARERLREFYQRPNET